MSTKRVDQMRPCTHKCCKHKGKKFADGKSGAWKQHKRTQGPTTHQHCSEICPGWDDLPAHSRIAYRPPPMSADDVLERDVVFRLLWILDPTSKGESKSSVECSCEWTEVDLRPQDTSMLRDPLMKGYIFGKPNAKALICEYVSCIIL
jgi:hypothetical protein